MQNKENEEFFKKFNLLNSQGSSQDNTEIINWSSSDASDYENSAIIDRNNTIFNKKRKRRCNQKTLEKLSNLNVTISDTHISGKKSKTRDSNKSPILQFPMSSNKPNINNFLNLSNVNHGTMLFDLKKSPKPDKQAKEKIIEPIFSENSQNDFSRSKSPILLCKFKHQNVTEHKKFRRDDSFDLRRKNDILTETNGKDVVNYKLAENTNSQLKTDKKSFFDSCFSSENSTQNTISDIPTQKFGSNTEHLSDNLDISSVQSEISNSLESIKETEIKDVSPTPSYDSMYLEKVRRIKYKKDGVAFRLNELLKKQNANVSLWHHERYLAQNSKFELPKYDSLTFSIVKVNFQYGRYILDVCDSNKEKYLILINNTNCLNNARFKKDYIFKLYKPYKIVTFNEKYKLIVNVCKFDSSGV